MQKKQATPTNQPKSANPETIAQLMALAMAPQLEPWSRTELGPIVCRGIVALTQGQPIKAAHLWSLAASRAQSCAHQSDTAFPRRASALARCAWAVATYQEGGQA